MAEKTTPTPAPVTDDPAMAAFLERLEASASTSSASNLSFVGLPGGEMPEALEDESVPDRGLGGIMGKVGQRKAPRYYTGYTYMPQALGWSPVEKRRLQNALVNAGLLQKDFRSGVWDEPSQEAFGQILALANQSGNDWETELVNYSKQQPMEYDPKTGQMRRSTTGGTMASRQKLVLNYTNPNDLSVLANETAQKRLGRKLTQGELQKFVTSYQSMERENQEAASAASTAGGVVTDVMNPEVAAMKAAEEADPVAYATRGILPAVDAINDLLKGRSFGEARVGEV